MTPGKTELFEGIHADFNGMVLQVCMGFLQGDRQLAMDLSQEVFINVWNALDRFRGDSGYKTWIYRITVNTCLKYIRDNKKRIESKSLSNEVNEFSESRRDDSSEALYLAIGRLNELDRLIMMLVLDELKYDEIASIIGISEGNLRVKIYRIKKNIKETLENERSI